MAEVGFIKDVIDDLRDSFFERLKRKIGWGKEEVKTEFERAISDTFVKAWDRRDTE